MSIACTHYLCVLILMQAIPLQSQYYTSPAVLYAGHLPRYNSIYYRNCAPTVTCNPRAEYRTINGSCNNLANPLWGSSRTPYVRVAEGDYADGDHELRIQKNGKQLPGPRRLQLELFLFRSHDVPDYYNQHLNQFAQWNTHDITLLMPDASGPENCCAVPINRNTPVQCEAVIFTPPDDPVLPDRQCMEFRRAMTATLNFDCEISPQIPMNQASAYVDASQLYGHTDDKAASIRTFRDGRLVTSVINGQEFAPMERRNGSSLCNGRENVNVCFDAGDPRANQHLGITLYTTMFTRFHNFVASKLKRVNPHWSDEKIYQEARKYLGAVNQIIAYRDYLPLLIGETYAKEVGLSLSRKKRTVYDRSIMPQLTIGFAASAFRVPHNILNSKFNFVDSGNRLKATLNLNEWMSTSDPLVQNSNVDNLLRGMTQSAGRKAKPSYNYLISNFMFSSFVTGIQDLLSVDIQRGRDCGVPPYNTMRVLCGYPRANEFKDFCDVIPHSDVEKLKRLYASVDDVDLLVAALLENPAPGAMVGPIARCFIADVFYRIRYGDRFFHDVEGQPGSFSHGQLNALRKIDLGHVFCATTGIDDVPEDIFKRSSSSRRKRSSARLSCDQHLLKMDFSPWVTSAP